MKTALSPERGALRSTSGLLRRVWIDHTFDVAAPREDVFALLADLDRWTAWTPGLSSLWRRGSDAPRPGTFFVMALAFPLLRRVLLPCSVYRFDRDCLEWGGGPRWSGVRHRFELHALDAHTTRVRHSEVATGALALFFRPFEAFAHQHDLGWSNALADHFRAGGSSRGVAI